MGDIAKIEFRPDKELIYQRDLQSGSSMQLEMIGISDGLSAGGAHSRANASALREGETGALAMPRRVPRAPLGVVRWRQDWFFVSRERGVGDSREVQMTTPLTFISGKYSWISSLTKWSRRAAM